MADSSFGCWIQVAADSILRLTQIPVAGTSCSLFYPTADSSSSSWIRVVAVSILWLTQVLVVGYKLQLILSCGWLEFRLLNTSCSWFYPMADSASGGWIKVTADSILQLTWVPAAGYELQLIPSHSWFHHTADSSSLGWIGVVANSSHGWFEFLRLDTNCDWFHLAAISSSGGWIGVVADSILWLTRVPVAKYELQVIPSWNWVQVGAVLSCNWLNICWLDSTSSCLIL